MSASTTPSLSLPATGQEAAELEAEVIDFFVALAGLIGQPPSVARIYGLLFISREHLSMSDLIDRLGLSKGSASQGLRFLRDVGAVKVVRIENDRRDYYEAETSLKKIVSGYLEGEVSTHITSGRQRIESLRHLSQTTVDPDGFYQERIARLAQWYQRGSRSIPLLKTFLSF